MSWLNSLMRPDLRDLAPYKSARAEAAGAAASIAIDANESPWPPFGSMAAKCEAHRYPEPQPATLRQRLAGVYGVQPEQLLLGRGSDEGIDLLLRLFCREGKDNIIICPPTFGMYQVYAAVQGAEVIKVPLLKSPSPCPGFRRGRHRVENPKDFRGGVKKETPSPAKTKGLLTQAQVFASSPAGGEELDNWQLDVPAILAACTPETKLIFIPSPNAPMGHMMRREDLLELCGKRAGQSLVVIDEAYVEFSNAPEGLIAELEEFPNLVLLRTMSKAHALAGERVGCVIGNHCIINHLQKIQAPYPLTRSSISIALDALSPNGLIQSRERRRLLKSERERMRALLPQSALVKSVFPGEANFLLLQTEDAAAFMWQLHRFGIRARNRDGEIPGAVRLTVSTPEENDMVLKALGIEVPQGAAEQSPRMFSVQRATRETKIDVTVNLDAPDFLVIETGIGFFDHMLAQLAQHGGFGLALACKGDLHVDQHHTIEDCALALGEALKAALGDKKGLARFGFSAPLDEALAEAVIDFSGRPHAEFSGKFPASSAGGMTSEMVPHFFRSLAAALGASLHITVRGDNTHHMIESCFKAAGRAMRQALWREGGGIPSTKGTL